jgi:hypothetical protein
MNVLFTKVFFSQTRHALNFTIFVYLKLGEAIVEHFFAQKASFLTIIVKNEFKILWKLLLDISTFS